MEKKVIKNEKVKWRKNVSYYGVYMYSLIKIYKLCSLHVENILLWCRFVQMLEYLLSKIGWDLLNNCAHCFGSEETWLVFVPPELLDGLILEEELHVSVVWWCTEDLLHDGARHAAVSWSCDAMRLKVVCFEWLSWILQVRVSWVDQLEENVFMIFIGFMSDSFKVETKPKLSYSCSSGCWDPVEVKSDSSIWFTLIHQVEQSLPVTSETPKHHFVELLNSWRRALLAVAFNY